MKKIILWNKLLYIYTHKKRNLSKFINLTKDSKSFHYAYYCKEKKKKTFKEKQGGINGYPNSV